MASDKVTHVTDSSFEETKFRSSAGRSRRISFPTARLPSGLLFDSDLLGIRAGRRVVFAAITAPCAKRRCLPCVRNQHCLQFDGRMRR